MSTPGGPPQDAPHAPAATPSSQLHFPSSSPAARARRSSPLLFPTSSPGRSVPSASAPRHTPAPPSDIEMGDTTPRPRMPASQASSLAPPRPDEPLFLPSSTPRRPFAHRGELAGTAAASSPLGRGSLAPPARRPAPPASQGSDLVFPPSTAGGTDPVPGTATPGRTQERRRQREVTMYSDVPSLSYGGSDVEEDAPDGQRKVIWGTSVNIDETLRLFRQFLRFFSLKYRWAHARKTGQTSTQQPEADGEQFVYQGYLRTMRRTDQVNLNLRISDLAAYGPSRRLASLLHKYPQEVIPIMDQALKDEMLELAETDAQNPTAEDDPSADLDKIEASLYKVRPFGLQSINMRSLNPNGTFRPRCLFTACILTTDDAWQTLTSWSRYRA